MKKKIFMIGYSSDKGGVEAFISNITKNLNDDFEIIYRLPVMNIGGKEWKVPENRHNYFKYIKFWKQFFKKNKFDVLYFNTCDIVSIDFLKFML